MLAVLLLKLSLLPRLSMPRPPPSVPRSSLRMSGAAGTAAGGGGDLAGGNDEERNAQLESLRKMFAASNAAESNESDDAKRLGLFLDLPLCRYSWCLLPGHQIAMSVWQPQYTLMFTKLLAEPPPHYYLHVLLPGGAESLGQPGYELVPGTNSALVGTLVRVVFAQRNPDSTLTLIVQGLCRGAVLRPTQYLPYSRGDVQILPDSEALLAAARASKRYLQQQGGATLASPVVKRRMVAAAASAEASCWFPYEAVQLSVDAGGALSPLNQLNSSAAARCASIVPDEVESALAGTPMPPSEVGEEEEELFTGSIVREWVWRAVEDAEAEPNAVEEEEFGVLAALEVQVWLEIDDMLQTLATVSKQYSQPSLPVPSQMLGLLPPPPAAGWPPTFELASAAARLATRYETDQGGPPRAVDGAQPLSYVPVDPAYPLRKRAERLSWVVWAVIGDQKVGVNAFNGSPYQVLLEADSTAERLRLVRGKLRELKEALLE